MSYSKLIHEYLDSQLNAVNEDVLFAELAKNPDLRVEFNQQVQFQNVAMSDMRTISPPTESTNAIFNSLGFTIPSSDYLRRIAPNPESGISMRPVGNAVSRFIRKHASTVAAVIITASLTTAVFMLTDNRFSSEPSVNEVAQVKKDIPVVSSQEKSDIATVRQTNLTNYTRTQRASVATIPDNSAEKTAQENSSNLASLFNNAPVAVMNNSDKQTNLFGSNSNLTQGFINNEVYDPFLNTLNIEPAKNFNDGNYAVIVSYSNPTPNVTVSAPGQSFFGNNINITTLYKMNDNWYVGASFGAEQFAMEFTTTFKGEGTQFERLPSIKYLTIGGKFALPLNDYFQYGEFLTGYIQMFGGSSLMKNSFMGKGQVGLTISGFNNIAINVGYEVSTFVYKVDNIQSTIKNGLVFGAGYSFK